VTESIQQQVTFDKTKCGNCLHMYRHLNCVTKKFVIGNVRNGLTQSSVVEILRKMKLRYVLFEIAKS